MPSIFKKLSVYLVFTAAAMLITDKTFGQEESPYPVRQVWVKQGFALYVGQTVKYKTVSANRFVQGQLVGITDHSLLFQDYDGVKIILQDDLEELKISTMKKNIGWRILGATVIMLVGVLVIYVSDGISGRNSSISSQPAPPSTGPNGGDILGGVIVAGGLAYFIVSAIPNTQTIKFEQTK